MRPRRLKRVVAAAASGIVLTGAGIGWAAQADADPNEWAYIAALDSEGIYYSSEAAAIDAGESVCEGLDAGLSLRAIGAVAMNAGYSASDAGYILGAAVGAFCPEYSYLIEGGRELV